MATGTERGGRTAPKDKSGFSITLRGDREIVMTRTFSAPRRLVFEAHSTCEHWARWLGPRYLTMISCEMDFRPGGAYRYVHSAPDKTEYAFRGEFREIVPPERIVQTFEFEAMPGHIAVDTLVLKEAEGKTYVTVTSRYSTTEDRDGMYSSGMEAGLRESWERLDEVLAVLAKQETSGVIETPQVVQSPAQHTAVVRLTMPMSRMQEVVGPGLSELMATVTAQGVATAGPWFIRVLHSDPDAYDFEIGVPVKTQVKAAGRVKPGQLPAARVARTVYQGPYEGLMAAWAEFDAWISTQGLKTRNDLWDSYVTGPESGADPSKWRTELNRPLAG